MKKFLNLLFCKSEAAQNSKDILEALEKDHEHYNRFTVPAQKTVDQLTKEIDWTKVKLVTNGRDYSYSEFFLNKWVVYPLKETKKGILEMIWRRQYDSRKEEEIKSEYYEV